MWPEVVPILTADDIVRGYRNHGGETHCLLGWNDAVFGGFVEAHRTVYFNLVQEINDTDDGYRGDVARFNDDDQNSGTVVARLWNRVMRKLGYTVPCER